MSICSEIQSSNDLLESILNALNNQSNDDAEVICGQPVGGGTSFSVIVKITAGVVTFEDTSGTALTEGVDFERCPGNQEIVDALMELKECICCPDEITGAFKVQGFDSYTIDAFRLDPLGTPNQINWTVDGTPVAGPDLDAGTYTNKSEFYSTLIAYVNGSVAGWTMSVDTDEPAVGPNPGTAENTGKPIFQFSYAGPEPTPTLSIARANGDTLTANVTAQDAVDVRWENGGFDIGSSDVLPCAPTVLNDLSGT